MKSEFESREGTETNHVCGGPDKDENRGPTPCFREEKCCANRCDHPNHNLRGGKLRNR